jgi:acyl-CoA synthetase (AMP-forming)/AMP-acid ligase II/acyl carrier protein
MSDLLNSPDECLNLVDLLRWRALCQPDRQVYTFLTDGETGEASLTYGGLDRRARAIGAALQNLGMEGECVLLFYPPGLGYLTAFWGCLYAAVVAVPSYPPRLRRADSRIQTIVKDARATTVLTTRRIFSDVRRRFAQAPHLKDLRWIATDDWVDSQAEDWRASTIDGDTLAFLQYTSGSTSVPKGVAVSHGNLMHNLAVIQRRFDIAGGPRGVSWLPFYHDMGLIGGVLETVYCGGENIFLSPFDFLQRPLRWLQAISRSGAAISGGPNFAYDLCVQRTSLDQRKILDLSSWKIAFNGAEPVRPRTIERFVEAFEDCGFRREAFYPCYGLAEATLIVSGGLRAASPVFRVVSGRALDENRVAPPADGDARMLVGSGHTMPGQRIIIVDPESLTLCSPDEIGEIWVSGPSVAQGYWNKPEETERTFRAYLADTGEGPFLRTGDLGFVRDDELFVTGRLKDLIIIRGRNHYPQDIELTVEQSHVALQLGCGAAFSVDVADEERLVVVQELKRTCRKADTHKVIQAVRQAVAKVHGLQVYAVQLLRPMSIPRTSSGKVQRYLCRSGFLAGTLRVVGAWSQNLDEPELFSCESLEPGTARQALLAATTQERQRLLETYLCEQLGQALEISPSELDIHHPVGELGIDSLTALKLKTRVETDLGIKMSIESFFEEVSTAQLVAQISDRLVLAPDAFTVLPANLEEAELLLERLDELSKQEVDSLLGDLLAERDLRL